MTGDTEHAESGTEPTAGHGPVDRPIGRPVEQRTEWAHLMRYGYAPGNYMSKCHNCEHVVTGVDKRAVTCRACAEALHYAWSKPPCQQCGAMTADEALSRCMGARAEGGCHGNELWPD